MGLVLHSVPYKTPLSPELPLPLSLRAQGKHLLAKKLPRGSPEQALTSLCIHPCRGKTFTTR